MATPEKIRLVAKRITQSVQAGQRLLVVVSAMGKTTDELTRLAYQVSAKPSRRELDMLLTTGERVSMALLSMALQDLGVPAISLTGSQAGVMTDSSHSQAKIIDIRPTRLREELERHRVVVLAGFQGVDPSTKEITTLGRGGSDTTAVAMSAALKAERCEIVKEVNGICSADPAIVANARTLNEVSYASLLEMTFWGAKILHYRSVELAQKTQVPLYLACLTNQSSGTRVCQETKMYENEAILAINSFNEVHHCAVESANLTDGLLKIREHLQKQQLPWPQVLASTYENQSTRLMYTSDNEHLLAIKNSFSQSKITTLREPLASVTLTCQSAMDGDLLAQSLKILGEQKILPQKLLQSTTSLTIFIEQKEKERAIHTLHRLIKA